MRRGDPRSIKALRRWLAHTLQRLASTAEPTPRIVDSQPVRLTVVE